jgi:hypothetical protein
MGHARVAGGVPYSYVTYVHTMIFLYFSNIYLLPYMNINRSTTPAGQSWFVNLVLLYATYNKYFHPTSTMTHFYVY